MKGLMTSCRWWSRYSLLCYGVILLFVLAMFFRSEMEDPNVKPYPALLRLVTNIDEFLWSRFDISALVDDPTWAEGGGEISSGFQVMPVPNVYDVNVFDICPKMPADLFGKLDMKLTKKPPSLDAIRKLNPFVKEGGVHRPSRCSPRYKVAIIIPYRNRTKQLYRLLHHMHPIWQRQRLAYKVYVINQIPGTLFNRAKLLNIGFAEASKDDNYDCFVFHDVDLLVENDMCLYHCPEFNNDGRSSPKHLSGFVEKFNYGVMQYSLGICSPAPYQAKTIQVFGGVTIFTKEQFINVNGFSNLYWGWGAEDDDILLRSWRKGYSVERASNDKCSFHMLSHEHEASNPSSPLRFLLLKQSLRRQNEDGLTSLKYRVIVNKKYGLFTQIAVDVGRPSEKLFDLIEMMKREYRPVSNSSCFEALFWLYNRLPKWDVTRVNSAL